MWRLTLMPKYRNGSESVCCSLSHFVSLNGLAAIVAFGCLESFLFRFVIQFLKFFDRQCAGRIVGQGLVLPLLVRLIWLS